MNDINPNDYISIEEMAKTLQEKYDNDVAKIFIYQITNLLKENGINVNLTRQEFSHIVNIDEYSKNIFEQKYNVGFKLDCSAHDNDIWNTAIDKCIDILDHKCSVEECTEINSVHHVDCDICAKIRITRLKDIHNSRKSCPILNANTGVINYKCPLDIVRAQEGVSCKGIHCSLYDTFFRHLNASEELRKVGENK